MVSIFASVVKARSLGGVRTRHTGIDAVIIRESTEGEYSAIEHESIKGVVECLKIVTEVKSHRIAKFAFDYAVKHGRKKVGSSIPTHILVQTQVTCIHKANIMKLGDGLFLRCCGEVIALFSNSTLSLAPNSSSIP